MQKILLMIVVLCVASGSASAQSKTTASDAGGTSLVQLIDLVAAKTAKKFVVDPRVRAQVTMAGIKTSELTYAELLKILTVNNFTAVEYDGVVRVVPMADARNMPLPTMSEGDQFLDDQFVSKVVVVKSVPAVQILPAIRPMMPAFAMLSIVPCSNSLVLVDRYANVNRLLGLIAALDQGPPLKPRDCNIEDVKKAN